MKRNQIDLHDKVNKCGGLSKVYDTVKSKACEITLLNILSTKLRQNRPELFANDRYLIQNSKEISV